jgi:hypothetical protein
MKTWKEVWSERIASLLSRRFLGFNGALILGYLRPEIFQYCIALYAIMVGGKVGQEWVRSRNGGAG